MKLAKKIFRICRDIIEIIIPSILFWVLFISFLIGIFCRYILKDPVSWTFEMGNICFLSVGLISCGIAHRKNDHVVFDLIYEKMSPVWKCISRIIGNGAIVFTALVLVPATIKYLQTMQLQKLYTQVIGIPRALVFSPFLIMILLGLLRSGWRLFCDVKGLLTKNYGEQYDLLKIEEGEA